MTSTPIPITTPRCTGRGTADGDHCCYQNNKVCEFLVDNGPGSAPRFRCGLRLKFDSWEGVVRSKEYQPIGEFWESVGQVFEYCMTWQPTEGECCREAR